MKLRHIVIVLALLFLMIKGCRAWAEETNFNKDKWVGKEITLEDEKGRKWKCYVYEILEDGKRMISSCYELIKEKLKPISEQEYRREMFEVHKVERNE